MRRQIAKLFAIVFTGSLFTVGFLVGQLIFTLLGPASPRVSLAYLVVSTFIAALLGPILVLYARFFDNSEEFKSTSLSLMLGRAWLYLALIYLMFGLIALIAGPWFIAAVLLVTAVVVAYWLNED